MRLARERKGLVKKMKEKGLANATKLKRSKAFSKKFTRAGKRAEKKKFVKQQASLLISQIKSQQ